MPANSGPQPTMHANLSMTGREPYHLTEGHRRTPACRAWSCKPVEVDGVRQRREYLREQIRAGRISLDETAELQDLTEFIDPDDTELLEWSGVPEDEDIDESESPRTPEAILADFDAGCRGQGDFDMRGLLWEIIEDVRSSYRLAISGSCGDFVEYTGSTVAEIDQIVGDYLVNHYGDN